MSNIQPLFSAMKVHNDMYYVLLLYVMVLLLSSVKLDNLPGKKALVPMRVNHEQPIIQTWSLEVISSGSLSSLERINRGKRNEMPLVGST